MFRSLIPSMFQRRLLLLMVGVLGVATVLATQAARVTIVEGADWLDTAEGTLVESEWTPTTRGRILDRKGRILAQDRPAFDVMVDYRLITGEWAEMEARGMARREHRGEWPKLSAVERAELVDRYAVVYREQLESLWSGLADATGVDREEIEDRKAEIKQEVQSLAGHLWSEWRERRWAELNRDIGPGGAEVEVTLADVSRPIREQRMQHPLVTGIDDSRSLQVRLIAERFEGVSLRLSGQRDYPFEIVDVEVDLSTFPPPLREDTVREVTVQGVATHVLGWMRELDRVAEGQPLDTERRPLYEPKTGAVDRGHYRPGDLVGGSGIESSREDILRGLRGREVRHLDTGEIEFTPFQPGNDVVLTLDVQLQARIQALLDPELGLARVQPWHHPNSDYALPDGTDLAASVVVLDVESGDVLAMVTTPSFTRKDLEDRPEWVFMDEVDRPYLNRAVSVPYEPGSIVKPMVLAAAVTAGVHSLTDLIECDGHFLDDPHAKRLRCWGWRPDEGKFFTHSGYFKRGLYADEAIGSSCNIYFYTLGELLGAKRVREWYSKFGVGETWGLGVGSEYPGVVKPTSVGEAIMNCIGQGPIAWTPLHAADAFATLERGGIRIKPRIDRSARPVSTDLRLDPGSVDAALAGLARSLNEVWGTGHGMNYGPFAEGAGFESFIDIDGVDVIGKTGTAQANPITRTVEDENGEQRVEIVRKGNHAWFVGLVGPEGQHARYSVSVLIEYGGSGGRSSAPVAAQVIHALKAEGYL
ncbi:MAG: peptidoglycan D,D-transpeptidase FtsI family protein [Phycisphaerales bacterium JB065]